MLVGEFGELGGASSFLLYCKQIDPKFSNVEHGNFVQQTLTQDTIIVHPSRRQPYRRDIDGLRAIAILSVVLFHAGVPGLNGGFVGVDVFFVISGYLIGAHVYADIRRHRFRITEFYRKRAKRILPALLVVLGFCEFAGLLVLSPEELMMLSRYCIATVASSANILAWAKSGYFASGADQNPLLMAWSLGVEEQFYIFFPLLMLVLGGIRRRLTLILFAGITLVSLTMCWWITMRNPSAAFYLLPTRAWELAVGVFLAIYEDGRDPLELYRQQKFANLWSILGIALIIFAVLRFDQHTSFPGLAAALPVFGSAMLIASPASLVNRIVLGSAPFVFVGSISYSLYLWHWPLLSLAHIISDQPISVSVGCAIAAISLVCAWCSYRWIEQPFRRSATPSIPLLFRYAMLCVLLALPAVVFHSLKGIPGRFVPMAGLESAREDIARDCVGEKDPVESISCINRNDPRPAVALIGDSHAAAIAPAVADLAEQSGFKLYRIFKYSCPPLIGVAGVLETPTAFRACLDFNAKTMKILTSDPSVRIVIMTAYWAGPEIDHVAYVTANQVGTVPSEEVSEANLERGLNDTLARLRAAGKKVIIVQDVPVFTFDPVRRTISEYIPVRRYIGQKLFGWQATEGVAAKEETYIGPQLTSARILQKIAAAHRVAVFDPEINLCAEEECRFLQDKNLLYGDKQHVTRLGARLALIGLDLR